MLTRWEEMVGEGMLHNGNILFIEGVEWVESEGIWRSGRNQESSYSLLKMETFDSLIILYYNDLMQIYYLSYIMGS